jgi:hypothetical protein
LSIYDDNYSRNILEILYMEFCTPGALDVVKDSINPMYMQVAAYDRFLKTRGHSEQEYAWRSAEFVRFKSGMDNNLKQGAEFREVLSLKRLNDIARRASAAWPVCIYGARLYRAGCGGLRSHPQGIY